VGQCQQAASQWLLAQPLDAPGILVALQSIEISQACTVLFVFIFLFFGPNKK
jgi:hypothetical protein